MVGALSCQAWDQKQRLNPVAVKSTEWRKMRTFVFVIGILLIIGGVTAVCSPEDFIMQTSGPDPVAEFGRDFLDRVSKERAAVTGYVTIFVGVAACAFGFFLKELKTPEPHDNPA